MIIRLGIGGTEIDVVALLDDEEDIVLSQENERDIFERVVDDLHLRVSNLHGTMREFFSVARSKTKIRAVVGNDIRTQFTGYAKPDSIEFSLDDLWVECDVFSTTKAMWDLLDTIMVSQTPLPTFLAQPIVSYELETLLDFIFSNSGVYEGVGLPFLVGVDCGEYRTRRIRGNTDDSGSLGNEGRSRELNPNMTLKQLHEEMAKYYNAEFFVEPSTARWTMRRRNTILNARDTLLDALIEEENIKLQLIDGRQMDYIFTHGSVSIPLDPPTLVEMHYIYQEGSPPGTYQYLMTGLSNDIEVLISAVTVVVAGNVPERNGWAFTMRMPAPPYPSLITKRNLYRRNDANPDLGYRRVYQTSSDAQVEITDGYSLSSGFGDLPQLGQIQPFFFDQWLRYDESIAAWPDPIIDVPNATGGSQRPPGKILDVRPQLQFVDPGTNDLRPYNPLEVRKFFMSDNSIDNIHNQFRDMFLTKRRWRVNVKGTDYRVGDSYMSSLIGGNFGISPRLLVKKASVNLTKDVTSLELLTV